MEIIFYTFLFIDALLILIILFLLLRLLFYKLEERNLNRLIKEMEERRKVWREAMEALGIHSTDLDWIENNVTQHEQRKPPRIQHDNNNKIK